MVGILALAMGVGMVALTGLVLTGTIKGDVVPATAVFENCGQGLREGGDVKLRGVLVGRIGKLELTGEGSDCRVGLDLFPADTDLIPATAAAEIRAKTIFGEKWVEIVVPEGSDDADRSSTQLHPHRIRQLTTGEQYEAQSTDHGCGGDRHRQGRGLLRDHELVGRCDLSGDPAFRGDPGR